MTAEELAAIEARAHDSVRPIACSDFDAVVAEVRRLTTDFANACGVARRHLTTAERAETERDAAQKALTESQAREAELRAALVAYPAMPDGDHETTAFMGRLLDFEKARRVALARHATDDSALREFGVKCVEAGSERHEPPLTRAEDIVDAVLRGER